MTLRTSVATAAVTPSDDLRALLCSRGLLARDGPFLLSSVAKEVALFL